MSEQESHFELPKSVERYLAALSKLYGQEGKRQLQEIIVNSQTRVVEAWSSDNWNVPFDIRHRRFLDYEPDKLTSLKARLEKTIKNILVRTK